MIELDSSDRYACLSEAQRTAVVSYQCFTCGLLDRARQV